MTESAITPVSAHFPGGLLDHLLVDGIWTWRGEVGGSKEEGDGDVSGKQRSVIDWTGLDSTWKSYQPG